MIYSSFELSIPMKRFIITKQTSIVDASSKKESIELISLVRRLKSPKEFMNTPNSLLMSSSPVSSPVSLSLQVKASAKPITNIKTMQRNSQASAMHETIRLAKNLKLSKICK
jgi:hypothetical protein